MQCLIEHLQAITESDDFQKLRKSIDRNSLHELFEWKDSAGDCLLHLCVVHCRLDCMDELLLLLSGLSLDIGKYVNGTNLYGRTPLHLAAFYGRDSAVERLVNLHGIEVDQQTNAGCTSLYFACCRSHASIVDRLLALGADPNVQTRVSSTPLIAATVNGSVPVVKALLEKGARCNVQNNEGKTALHVAAEINNKEIMDLLLSHGADSLIKDQRGRVANEILLSVQEEKFKAASITLPPRSVVTPQRSHTTPHVRHEQQPWWKVTAPSPTTSTRTNTRPTTTTVAQPAPTATASHSENLSSPSCSQSKDPTLGRLCEALNSVDSSRQNCSRNDAAAATAAANLAIVDSLYHNDSVSQRNGCCNDPVAVINI